MTASKYNKADIVDFVCERSDTNKKEIRTVIDLFIDELKEALKRNRVIELRGFGTFEIKTRKGRSKARNPKTGESVEVISHCVAVFRPGRTLKQAVWNLASAESGAGLAGDCAGLVEGGPAPPGAERLPGDDESYFQ
jgi:integration host factor subunit beta